MIGIQKSKQRPQVPESLAARLAQLPRIRIDGRHPRPPSAETLRAAELAQPRAGGGTQQAVGEPDLRFLLHHGTMGFSLLDYSLALPLGWQGWLNDQLNPAGIDDSEVDAVLAQLPTLTMSPSQLLLTYPDDQVFQIVAELQYAVFLRAIYSKRQLFERMVTFWTDHFNISQLDGACLWLKTDDDRRVIRSDALGSFPDMLRSSARSPAMLWYLDNYANTVGTAQENYARELLELHTLGVDGPYTENDVREVARCFTGWTLGSLYDNAPVGEFTFVPQIHDTGAKTVLGVTIPAGGGIEDGERVLEILAGHPKTAEFISRKLCRWLLMAEPPPQLVDEVAQVYMQTAGDIPSMIRVIFDPNVVAAIPPQERTKIRQPLHHMIAVMRATLTSSDDLLQLLFASIPLGQSPYWWPTPDGPPDTLDKWGKGVLPRWDFASQFFAGNIPGNIPDISMLFALIHIAPGDTNAARINWALTGGRIDPSDEAEVERFIEDASPLTNVEIREAFALAASSPGFQFI